MSGYQTIFLFIVRERFARTKIGAMIKTIAGNTIAGGFKTGFSISELLASDIPTIQPIIILNDRNNFISKVRMARKTVLRAPSPLRTLKI